MRAIILAAGQGKRLGPITDDKPKCLVDLGPATILSHQLNNCERAGLDEVVVVTGAFAPDVEAEIERWRNDGARRVRVSSLYNPFHEVANNMISLWAARAVMDVDFITINGDDIFDWRILERLAATDGAPVTVTIDQKEAYDEDDMKIILDGGRITAMNKKIPVEQANGESIGIMKFCGKGRALLAAELEAMARLESYATEWYVQAVERIALADSFVDVMPVGDLRWAEVDFPEDLENVRANLLDLVACTHEVCR